MYVTTWQDWAPNHPWKHWANSDRPGQSFMAGLHSIWYKLNENIRHRRLSKAVTQSIPHACLLDASFGCPNFCLRLQRCITIHLFTFMLIYFNHVHCFALFVFLLVKNILLLPLLVQDKRDRNLQLWAITKETWWSEASSIAIFSFLKLGHG